MRVLDANVLLTHAVDFTATGVDGRLVRVQRHNRGEVAAVVDAAAEAGDLAIPDTAAAEARKNVRHAVVSAAKDAGAVHYDEDKAVDDALAKIAGLYRRFRVPDSRKYVKTAGAVYADAWSDERMQGAIAARRLVKEGRGRDASMPTPETNKGDFRILSTAAYLVELGFEVTLLTFDQDFVAFAAAIREGLGVVVVDCGRLGR